MFDEFTEGNDPYQEHDFGSLTLRGQKLFWKIDYYDSAMQHGSENPCDPEITRRVLTVMLVEEGVKGAILVKLVEQHV